MTSERPPKALRIACKETYDKLDELEDLIRSYAEAEYKKDNDFDLVYVEDALHGICVARGRISTFSWGWVEHDGIWVEHGGISESKEEDNMGTTIRQIIEELNQIPEENKDKIVCSISATNSEGIILPLIVRPNSRVTWDCDEKSIALGFYQVPNEDTK